MLDHIGFGVSDFARSKAFYERALAPVGVEQLMEFGGTVAGFGEDGMPYFWLHGERPPVPVQLHVAFTARDRAAVDAFHAAGLEAGGTDNGGPGLRSYHENYYAAFVLDPDGHNIEAVCHRAP